MATYTVKVKSVCSGGGHVTLTIRKDGVAVREYATTLDELKRYDIEWDAVIPSLLKMTIKNSGATTLAQAKTAIESAEWVI